MSAHIPWDSRKGSDPSSNNAHRSPSAGAGPVVLVGAINAMHAGITSPALQSCSFCRKRKIKCDKVWPTCTQCTRAGTLCTYPPSQRRGRPRTQASGSQAPMSREEQLLRRIKKLETVIETLKGGGDGEEDSTTDSMEPLRQRLGRLVVGKPYLNDSFWDSNELKDILEEDTSSSSESEDEDRSPEAFNTDWIVGTMGPAVEDLHWLHPPLNLIPRYYALYQENCESIIRMFHRPTTDAMVQEALSTNLGSLNRVDELIMFCFYFAALTSLSDEDALQEFGHGRDELLTRYEIGIKQALTRAQFMHTQDLKVLQAFVVYLLCIKHSDATSGTIWTMTGLAIRIAQGMALDRDGEHFGLKPFDIEYRRRVWWQLLLLDVRSSEARGCLPTLLMDDTRLPTLLNDTDLDPDMETQPKPRVGLSDMTISLVRFSICQMGRRLHGNVFKGEAPLSLQAKKKTVEDFEKEIAEKYLQYCDQGGPVYQYGANTARLITSRMQLMIHKRSKQAISQEDKDKLFLISLNILDYTTTLAGNTSGQKFSWLLKTHTQWHAVAFILAELCARDPSPNTERAWKIIDESEPNWKPPTDAASSILYSSVKKLLSKAQSHRKNYGTQKPNKPSSSIDIHSQESTPPYIGQVPMNIDQPFVSQPPPQLHLPHLHPSYVAMQQPQYTYQGPIGVPNIPVSMPNQIYSNQPQMIPQPQVYSAPPEDLSPWYFEPPQTNEPMAYDAHGNTWDNVYGGYGKPNTQHAGQQANFGVHQAPQWNSGAPMNKPEGNSTNVKPGPWNNG